MDPYLEDPVLWPGVQQDLITFTKAQLNRLLPPDYATNTRERVYDPVEMPEGFLEILSLREKERVVTVIEVLTYTRSDRGSNGGRAYEMKQKELLASPIHFIEIVLLRECENLDTPRPKFFRKKCDYFVSLHRGSGNHYEVWATTVRHPLPVIQVPLAGDDSTLTLDLQAVFDRSYDEGGYARRIDYAKEPHTLLAPDDATWADALLKEKGYR